MFEFPKAMATLAIFAAAGCIDSGNRGWDLGSEPDLAGGPAMEQAWRGVHEGRIGFRCRDGNVVLFVETWHPLDAPAQNPSTMRVRYRFDAGSGSTDAVEGAATRRGVEIAAQAIGQEATGAFLQGLASNDELFVNLDGARHGVNVRFDISDAAHAHRHVTDACRRASSAGP